jgi:hypothetical protein
MGEKSILEGKKQRLLNNIDSLDIAESTPLIAFKREAMKDAHEKVAKLRRDEKSKWTQRAKVKHIKGGNNPKFF